MKEVKFVPVKGGGIARLELDTETGKEKSFVFKISDAEVARLLNTLEDNIGVLLSIGKG